MTHDANDSGMTGPDPARSQQWKSLFSSVAEGELTPDQRNVLNVLRRRFPGIEAGRYRGELRAFVDDPLTGPISFPLG